MSFSFIILNNIEFFVFIAFLCLFLYLKKKNIRVDGTYPNMYMMLYRTRLGLDRMKSWSKNNPKFFLYLSYFSIFIGIVGTIASFIFLIWQLGFLVENEITRGGGFVLPLKTEKGLDSAVPVFYVPFWYWIVAIFILMVVHEFAHGVIGERFDVKIKSSGFAFFGSMIIGILVIVLGISWGDVASLNFTWDMLGFLIMGLIFVFIPVLPGAFVEPDQEDIKKKEWWKQIAVFGAGSMSNFIFGFLFLAMWIFLAIPFFNITMETGSIHFSSIANESDLSGYNVTSGEIVAFNGEYDKTLLLEGLVNLSVNESVNITIFSNNVTNTYSVVTFENPTVSGKGMIGVSGLVFDTVAKKEYSYLGDIPKHFEKVLFWTWFLNLGIGMMNLLPLWITDGGQITRTLFTRYIRNEKLALKLYNYISFISLIVIVFTLYPPLLYSIIGLF